MHKETSALQEATLFSNFSDDWMKANSHRLKISSLTKYSTIIELHLKPEFGNCCAEEITSDRISAFSQKLLKDKGLSVKTVRDILTFFHQLLEAFRQENGELLESVKIPYPREKPTELRVLTEKEQLNLTRYLNQDMDIYKFSVLLALTTGLRIGEICGLKWEDISMDSGLVTVKNTVQRVKNPDPFSTQKTILLLGTPKTATSFRTIPLTPGALVLCKKFQTIDSEAFLLTGNTCIPEPRFLQRRLKHYTSELNLENVHFHTLRHTFATRCVEIGCDIKTLSVILGHSSTTITMNRYVHPSFACKQKNIQKLEQAGFGCIVD